MILINDRAPRRAELSSPELASRLRTLVERLAIPRHRLAEPAANSAIREWLIEAFETLGLEVTVQGRYQNVVALPRGAQRVTLIGAHYDSVPGCPGADDNASGVAGLRALLWTDTANFRNPHYHRASDRPETLDYQFMARVTELLVEVVKGKV